MVWFLREVKQRRSRLVPGWVTALLDSVYDPVHASQEHIRVKHKLRFCIGYMQNRKRRVAEFLMYLYR